MTASVVCIVCIVFIMEYGLCLITEQVNHGYMCYL